MICLDIDVTLLNSKHKITPKTKEAIKKIYKEKNIPVILISARMPDAIFFLQKELEIKAPIVCYSGALVLDSNYNIISNVYINCNFVKEVLTNIEGLDIHKSLYSNNKWFISKEDKWSRLESKIIERSPSIINFEELFKVKYISESGFNKILLIGDEVEAKKTYELLKKMNTHMVNIHMSKPTYIEIMSKNISKTKALKELLNIYNIDKSEVLAIGDNYNDMDMLEFAGMGIAMGNAPDEVKRISNDVTLSNDEDGVAEAIYKHFLL